MATRTGLLTPRTGPAEYGDLAGREPFIRGQRVGRRGGQLRGRWQSQIVLGLRLCCAVLIGVTLAVTAARTAQWLLTAPEFAVGGAEMLGVGRLDPQEVLHAAGIVRGSNIFRVDPLGIRRLVEAIPQVKRAAVVRRLPNRVTIWVEEREPFALVSAPGLYWVDEGGVILTPQLLAVVPSLPVLSGVEGEAADPVRGAPSDRLLTGLGLLRVLLRLGGSLPATISEVDLSRSGGPVLYTVEGTEVRLGEAPWEEKLTRLGGVISELRRRGEQADYIDLRFRNLVVLKPRKGGA